MIRIDTHGREWIMEQSGMKDNPCPECKTAPCLVNVHKPQESEVKCWFDCECKRCGCEWTVEYRKEIEYV